MEPKIKILSNPGPFVLSLPVESTFSSASEFYLLTVDLTLIPAPVSSLQGSTALAVQNKQDFVEDMPHAATLSRQILRGEQISLHVNNNRSLSVQPQSTGEF